MNKVSIILLVLVFVQFFPSVVSSQDKYNKHEANLLLNSGYVGHTIFTPHLGNKGFDPVEPWKGFEVNAGGFLLEYLDGTLRERGVDSTVANVSGRMYRIGMQLGKPFRLGHHSLFSLVFEPYCKIQASYAEMPNKPVTERLPSIGLVVSPGLSFKFSQFYFSASYNGGGYLNSAFWGGNKKHNIFPGFMGGYTFSFGIDTNFDVLVPRAFTANGLDVYKRTYTNSETYYDWSKGAYYRKTTTTVYREYSEGSRALNLIKAFWGIGPTYSYASRRFRQASTEMIGVNLGARFNYICLDAFYEEGQMGTADQVDKDQILITYPQLRNYDFSAQVETKQYGGRIGVNITKFLALKHNFIQDGYSRRNTKNAVTYGRLNVFFTAGMAEFSGNPVYTYEDGSARLADFQSKRSITPSAENNPDYLPESSFFYGWGGSIEIGSAFLKMTKINYTDAPIADHLQYTVGSNIPIGRLWRSISARFFL